MTNRIRARLTYANVIASLALFVALGGTGYAAATLPRNSVTSAQIRSKAVGSSELRTSAVTSSKVRNGSIATRDLSASTRSALRGSIGPAGPQGPAGGTFYRAAVTAGGGAAAGNSRGVGHTGGSNEYRIDFPGDVSGCIFSATLAGVPTASGSDQPEAGRITATSDGSTRVLVRTFRADGTPGEQPFHLLVTC